MKIEFEAAVCDPHRRRRASTQHLQGVGGGTKNSSLPGLETSREQFTKLPISIRLLDTSSVGRICDQKTRRCGRMEVPSCTMIEVECH